ncbi:hypothetical protein TSAR_007912 [Trichomalopsis sarcophagae]|uniref:Integrase catalytic domain-containing protein n=1 Tax=Trichomalopsis sarcophagae TaxID=543379 RepID=A0A232FM60_9HYME|nr:hypothetical protein TSAR_007912 [Trichomalopsis sarcophagae]
MHMSPCKDDFTSMQPNTNGHMVRVAYDRIIAGIGIITIQETIEGITYEREVHHVVYVPELRCNLLSIRSVNKRGYSFHSFEDRCEIRENNGKLALRGVEWTAVQNAVQSENAYGFCNAAQAGASNKIKLWHERMGYVLGKQSRKPHLSVGLESNYGPGEKIHTDVCRPVNISTPSGTRFFLVLKDESTGFRKVYFMAHKSKVINRFKEFEAFVRTQIGTQIKVLRSDNGTEYTCGKFQTFLKERRIIHELSSPYIHEQNGRAEREIRALVESERSMLHAKKVDKKLWSEAVNAACYILNQTINPGDTTTPFEKWFRRKPTIKHLKIFGARAYMNVLKEKWHKFDPKSKPISSDVTFNENAMSSTDASAEPTTVAIEFDAEERDERDAPIAQQEPQLEEQIEDHGEEANQNEPVPAVENVEQLQNGVNAHAGR